MEQVKTLDAIYNISLDESYLLARKDDRFINGNIYEVLQGAGSYTKGDLIILPTQSFTIAFDTIRSLIKVTDIIGKLNKVEA